MTNEEAIETLKTNYPDACFEQLREAVDMAIEALKAQPEPTLEQIEEYCHKRCLSIVDNALLHKYAQPEQQWIPCSERPPEKRECVLTCSKDGEICINYYNPIAPSKWAIVSQAVVAWMPLPEPYKGDS